MAAFTDADYRLVCKILHHTVQEWTTTTTHISSNINNYQFHFTFIFSSSYSTTPHHNRVMAFFRDYPGEPVPEEKLLDFMVQGKIKRGRHTDHVKALKAASAFALGRKR